MLRKAMRLSVSKCQLFAGSLLLLSSSCAEENFIFEQVNEAAWFSQEEESVAQVRNDQRATLKTPIEVQQKIESEDEAPRGDGDEGIAPDGVEKSLLELEFKGIPDEAILTTNKLDVVVKNVSEFSVKAKLEFRCFGFFDKMGKANLPSISLQEGEEKTVQLPIDRLPLQNISGANQMHVVAYINKPEFPEDGEVRSSSNQIFYQFSEDYSTAMFFNIDVLKEQFGGCLAGLCSESIELGQTLGRIKGDSDVYTDVTLTGQSIEVEEGVYVTPPTSDVIGQ